MEVIVAGNVKSLSHSFFRCLGIENKIVLCDGDQTIPWNLKNGKVYHDRFCTKEFENIFRTYNFGASVYFSKTLDGEKEVFDELEYLEKTLRLSQNNNIINYIYVTSNEWQENEIEESSITTRRILFESCKQLCKYYAKKYGMNVTVLKVPYLYQSEHFHSFMGNLIWESMKHKKVVLPGTPETEVDFLSADDLGLLIVRILDNPCQGYVEMNLSGEERITLESLSTILRKRVEGLHVDYEDSQEGVRLFAKDLFPREEYGWFPTVDFQEEIFLLWEKAKETLSYKKNKKHHMNFRWIELATSIVELFVMFVLMIFLRRWIGGNDKFAFFDYRLLFVVVMGTMRGLPYGIGAGFLAYVSYLYGESDLNLQGALYNMNQWLPFSVYFLTGAISGYTRDKKKDQLEFIEKDFELLKDKYVFLGELYQEAIENKEEFNNQIISYGDSYGRIYDVVKRLNTTLPEKVFLEAIQVTEEVLQNNYVAIYTVEEGPYARLRVCSKELNELLPKSIKMTDYPEIFQVIGNNETWINTECILDYPVYAAPIIGKEHMEGFIFLQKADYHQMSMEYVNKFNIVTGLIKDFLLRAMERTRLVENNIMLPGTKILNQENFRRVWNINNRMQEKDVSEYLLLRLEFGTISLSQLSAIIYEIVRGQDVLGQGEDNGIYLLLSQANKKYLSAIGSRLEEKQIYYYLVEGERVLFNEVRNPEQGV